MSIEQVNKLQEAIDAKANLLASKDEKSFMGGLCKSLSAASSNSLAYKIKDYLPEGYDESHVNVIVNAMRSCVREDSFKRHREVELNNVTSILDFMNQYNQQTEE